MVQGVGGTGSGGTISDISAYQTYYPMYQAYLQSTGSNLDFESWLIMKGYYANFIQQVENKIETGNSRRDDETQDAMNATQHISNGTGAIYQSADEDTLYEFDWESGTYREITDKDEMAQALGLPSDVVFDVLKLGFMNATFVDYTFGNLDDGQDSSTRDVYGNYANVSLTQQEFDIHYILNALLMDPTDPQYQIAKEIFDELCANSSQWLPDSDLEELNQVAAEYGTNSAEYKAKLQEILLKNLDQANEWVEDHAHVKNPNTGQVSDTVTDNSTNTGNSTDGTNSSNPTAGISSSYDKTAVIMNTSVYADYAGEKSTVCSSYDKKGKAMEEGKPKFVSDATAKLTEIGNALKAQLQSELGDAYDDALISEYIQKAISSTIDQFLSECPTDKNADGGNYHCSSTTYTIVMSKKTANKGRVVYNNKALVDYFFNEFNTLCDNNGKTAAEVEAEKKAAEEKAAKEKAGYQELYGMSMSSVASEAGVNKDVQVVNVNSAAEIQAEAEAKILQPLMEKIKAKMAGKGIPDSDLQTMLNNAATYALNDCTEWASTSNNYVYTIDSSLLIERFEDNVKTLIKAKGYDF